MVTNYIPGALHRPADPRDYRFRAASAVSTGKWLPAKPYNRIAGWPDTIYDQGATGNCKAQNLRAISEYYEGYRTSVDWIYGRMRNREDTQRGMYVEDALRYFAKLGSIPYDMMPGNTEVTAVIDKAYALSETLDPLSRKSPIEGYVYICGYNGPERDDQQMVECIDKGWPVSVTVYGTDLLYTITIDGHSTVDMRYAKQSYGDHAVLIIGYRVINGNLYWEVQNSWGKGWGDNGIKLLPAEYKLFSAYAIVDDLSNVIMPEEGSSMVDTYSLKKDGNTKLSTNFKVSEFKCKDGSDTILIDSGLVDCLQRIRDHFGGAVTVTSGYRTESYNTEIKGAKKSKHMQGTAADFQVSGVDPRDVARWCELNLPFRGLGLYDYSGADKMHSFVHIDTSPDRYAQWVQTERKGSDRTVNSIIKDYLNKKPTVKLGSTGDAVTELETLLAAAGYPPIGSKADEATVGAIKAFQRDNGLTADGIAGSATWGALTSI